MIGNTFKQLKNHYTGIDVSDREIEKRWQVLSAAMPAQDLPKRQFFSMSYGQVFLSIVIMLFVITIAFSQVAKPGSLFYSAHTVTQEITKGVTQVFQSAPNHVKPPQIYQSMPMRAATPSPRPSLTPTPKPTETEIHNDFQKEENGAVHTMSTLGAHTERDVEQTQTQKTHGNSHNSAFSNDSPHGNTESNSQNPHENNDDNSHGNSKK